jgi:hypothetical protein
MGRREARMPMDAGKRTTKRIRRASSADTDYDQSINVSTETSGSDSERVLLEKVLDELKDLKDESIKQRELICKLEQEVISTKEQLQQVVEQLQAATCTATTSTSPLAGHASYADVARTPPGSLPSNVRSRAIVGCHDAIKYR